MGCRSARAAAGWLSRQCAARTAAARSRYLMHSVWYKVDPTIDCHIIMLCVSVLQPSCTAWVLKGSPQLHKGVPASGASPARRRLGSLAGTTMPLRPVPLTFSLSPRISTRLPPRVVQSGRAATPLRLGHRSSEVTEPVAPFCSLGCDGNQFFPHRCCMAAGGVAAVGSCGRLQAAALPSLAGLGLPGCCKLGINTAPQSSHVPTSHHLPVMQAIGWSFQGWAAQRCPLPSQPASPRQLPAGPARAPQQQGGAWSHGDGRGATGKEVRAVGPGQEGVHRPVPAHQLLCGGADRADVAGARQGGAQRRGAPQGPSFCHRGPPFAATGAKDICKGHGP